MRRSTTDPTPQSPDRPDGLWVELANAVGDLIIVCDRDLRVLSTNAAAAEVLGYAEGAMVGEPLRRLFDPADHAALDAAWQAFSAARRHGFAGRHAAATTAAGPGAAATAAAAVAWPGHVRSRSGWKVPVAVRAVDAGHRPPAAVVLVASDLSDHATYAERFEFLFHRSPALLAVVGRVAGTLTLVDANHALVERLGYPADRLIGRAVVEILTRNSVAVFGASDSGGFDAHESAAGIAQLERLLTANGVVDDLELQVPTAGGRPLSLIVSARHFRHRDQPLVFCAMTDITERKATEREIRRSAELRALLATESTRFITIAAREIDTAIETALQRAGTMLGVDRAYVFLFAGDRLSCSNTHEWCAAGVEPQIANLQEVPTALVPWWMVHIESNRPVVINDVAAMPPEAALEQETLLAQAICSLVVVPMIFGDKIDGFIGFDVVRRTREWSEVEVDSLRMLAAIITNAVERKAAHRKLARAQRSLRRINLGLEKRDRERKKSLLNYVAKLNKAQEIIVQQEKLASIGQLAAGVAHEVNNPTSFILSNLKTFKQYVEVFEQVITAAKQLVAAQTVAEEAQTVAEEAQTVAEEAQTVAEEAQAVAEEAQAVADGAAFVERFRQIDAAEDLRFLLTDSVDLLDESIEGVRRIKDIVLNLEGFARKDEHRRQPTDINALVEKALKVTVSELKHRCDVVTHLTDLPLIRANQNQIVQVLLNLFINAAHAMEQHGTLTVSTSSDTDSVLITVKDTGKGIQPADINRIFDPFFTTKAPGEGTGLGLSVSLGIVADHGGTIEVKSTPAAGATFVVRLPVHVEEDAI